MKIAVYGTLKKGKGANHLLYTSIFLGERVLNGYSLYVHTLPYILPNESGFVRVELYEVPEGIAVDMIDHYEGHPKLYQRTLVYLNGDEVYVYIPNKEDTFFTNNPEYLVEDGVY